MGDDAEITALRVIQEALESLDRAARKRVIDWADQRYVTDAIASDREEADRG